MRFSIPVLALAALAAALAACHGPEPLRLPGTLLGDASPRSGGAIGHAEGPSGGARLTIRWPERSAQFIPTTANRIAFAVYRTGIASPLATASVTRPASTVTFDRLPVESLRFTAEALDPDGFVGATGSAQVTIRANAVTSGAISMASTVNPVISDFSPRNGCPGQQVTITGSGFAASRNASYSVSFGGVTLPGDRIFRFSDTQMGFFIPSDATNGSFAISIDGVSRATDSIFRTIKTLSISPTSVTLSTESPTQSFQVTAWDSAGISIVNPTVPWALFNQNCPGCGTSTFVASIDQSGLLTRGSGTGTVQVGVGIAPVRATASVTVN